MHTGTGEAVVLCRLKLNNWLSDVTNHICGRKYGADFDVCLHLLLSFLQIDMQHLIRDARNHTRAKQIASHPHGGALTDSESDGEHGEENANDESEDDENYCIL